MYDLSRLTMQYEEWLCVTKGRCIAKSRSGEEVIIEAGETAYISKGSSWKPTFPVETSYIAICKPAFRPDRCVREEENNQSGMDLLKKMHADSSVAPPQPTVTKAEPIDKLHHMTTRALWNAVKDSGEAYYPPTFDVDGYYTHATAVPSRLITTANNFYQEDAGEWICLIFSRAALKKCGIFVKDEEALPVGDRPIGGDWDTWICPHVIGGIPPSIVTEIFVIQREGKTFVGIEGLI
jgi:hypothetical protein